MKSSLQTTPSPLLAHSLASWVYLANGAPMPKMLRELRPRYWHIPTQHPTRSPKSPNECTKRPNDVVASACWDAKMFSRISHPSATSVNTSKCSGSASTVVPTINSERTYHHPHTIQVSGSPKRNRVPRPVSYHDIAHD